MLTGSVYPTNNYVVMNILESISNLYDAAVEITRGAVLDPDRVHFRLRFYGLSNLMRRALVYDRNIMTDYHDV